jgi:hypothetical protein
VNSPPLGRLHQFLNLKLPLVWQFCLLHPFLPLFQVLRTETNAELQSPIKVSCNTPTSLFPALRLSESRKLAA